MHNYSRCKEKMRGELGRKRNYKCRGCGSQFQHDGGQLPERARLCSECLKLPELKKQYDMAFAERAKKGGE